MKYSAVCKKIFCLFEFVSVKIAYCYRHKYCIHSNWHWFPAHFAIKLGGSK